MFGFGIELKNSAGRYWNPDSRLQQCWFFPALSGIKTSLISSAFALLYSNKFLLSFIMF